VVNWLPDPHIVQVVGELLPTIEADNIGVPWPAGFAHPGERAREMAVGTAEQQIQKCIDHAPTPRFHRDALSPPSLWQKHARITQSQGMDSNKCADCDEKSESNSIAERLICGRCRIVPPAPCIPP